MTTYVRDSGSTWHIAHESKPHVLCGRRPMIFDSTDQRPSEHLICRGCRVAEKARKP